MIEERFIRYVKFDTQSDKASDTTPSTAKQLKLAEELKKECEELGFDSVKLIDGTVYAVLNGQENRTPIGLVAHMDTASELTGANVKPRKIEKYDGGTIVLNEKYSMSPEDFPVLSKVVGDDLIVTDGSTLLGADDKAGIAIIMEAMDRLIHSDKEHGLIAVAFTPDEEIGRGVDHFRLEEFPVDFAYTVDGGDPRNIDYETFNAAEAVVEIAGKAIHPGDAKDKMINAALLAVEFAGLLPADEIPAKTSGRQGFYHLVHIEGEVDHAKLVYILREHDWEKFEHQKQTIEKAADTLNARYGKRVSVKIHDQYKNMKEYMHGDMRSVERAQRALEKAGLEPRSVAVRGGTDGAMLTVKGLITPNLGTGSANHHGRYEFADLQKMEQMVDVVLNILEE